jgi:Glyoxalase-like domain
MAKQLPNPAETFLDHIAHFVPEMEPAENALRKLGFTLTPFTAQQNRTPTGVVPAGMANRCIMFRQGYVEFLTAVSDTELAQRFRAAVARHTGLHLVAMSIGDAESAHARLEAQGFRPDPPVHLARPVEDADGRPLEARFTVLRVPPDAMPEGRIQLLVHHTEEAVWQERWLDHTNGIVSLEAVLVAVPDPEQAAQRFGRFVDRAPRRLEAERFVLPLDRGTLVFVASGHLDRLAPWIERRVDAPWIAGYALGSADPGLTRDRFLAGGLDARPSAPTETAYVLPPALGGFVTVAPAGAGASWAG